MTKLLKADFFRMKNDVFLLITLLLVLVFPIISAGSVVLLNTIIDLSPDIFAGVPQIQMTGFALFASSFDVSSGLGLIIPVFVGVFVCKEFSSNIIRNKVIAGHSKVNIYLSLAITALVYSSVMITLYSLVNLLFGTLLFGYGYEFTLDEFFCILTSIFFGIVIYMVFAAIATFVAAVSRSLAVTLAVLIGMPMLLSFLSLLFLIGLPDAV